MSNRVRKILFSVVAEYIATGSPVGSRTVSRKYIIDLSAATIRNVLSDLEDAGYLMQPHTSAGRVPTDVALRAFIEALTEFPEIPRERQRSMREQLEEIFSRRVASHDALRQTGKLLSELTGTAAIVATSPRSARTLSQLRFIPTGERLLAVLVFSDGMVENRYVKSNGRVSDAELTRIHNLLADVVDGRSLGALRDLFARRLADDKDRVDELRRTAFELGGEALNKVTRDASDLVIEGRTVLMDLPEYADVDKLKALVRALEDRENLVVLLDDTIEAGAVSVYIGNETGEFGDEAELSVVAAPFGDNENGQGTVGVLGPTRMDYAKLMPLVGATAKAITAAIKKSKS